MKKSERKEAWFRILVAIISGIILNIWKILIIIFGIVHWFIVVFYGKRPKALAEFSEYGNTEFYSFSKYLTFVSNERPFPFTSMQRMSKFK